MRQAGSNRLRRIFGLLRAGAPPTGAISSNGAVFSSAQALPEDILLHIFTLIRLALPCEGRRILQNCTLVCRSWSRLSSVILLHDIDVWWETQDERYGIDFARFKALISRTPRTDKHVHEPPTPNIGQLSRALAQSPRLTALIRELHIRTDVLKYWEVRTTVVQLENLRVLKLGCGKLVLPSEKQLRSAGGSLRMPGRSLDCLRLAGGKCEGANIPSLGLVDLLSWFDACDELELDLLGPHSDVQPQKPQTTVSATSISSLRVSALGFEICFGPYSNLILDYRGLRNLRGGLQIPKLISLYSFLSTHGGSLEQCELYLVSAIPADIRFPRERVQELNIALLTLDKPMRAFASCDNLRTLCLSWSVEFYHQASTYTFRRILDNSFADITAAPALQELFLGLQITSYIAEFTGNELTSGGVEETHMSLTSYVLGLKWKLLDRELRRSSHLAALQLPAYPHNAQEPVSLRLKLRLLAAPSWTPLPVEERARCYELIRAKLSPRMRECVSCV